MRSLRWRAIGEVGPEVALTPGQAACRLRRSPAPMGWVGNKNRRPALASTLGLIDQMEL